jgi:Plasmid pRiA4b ORF-3-like protein
VVRLRVVVRGVSPLIVRTIEVPADATLLLLHEALLVCLDWSGEHLHAFTIRAVDYSADWMIDGLDTRDVTIGRWACVWVSGSGGPMTSLPAG